MAMMLEESTAQRYLRSAWTLFDHDVETPPTFNAPSGGAAETSSNETMAATIDGAGLEVDGEEDTGMPLLGRMLISVSSIGLFFLVLAIAVMLERRRERAARAAALDTSP